MKAFGQGGRQRKQPQVYRSKPPTWHTALGSQISSASAIPLPQVLIPEGKQDTRSLCHGKRAVGQGSRER